MAPAAAVAVIAAVAAGSTVHIGVDYHMMLALAVLHSTAVAAAAVAVVAAGHKQQTESSAPQCIQQYMHLHIAELICTIDTICEKESDKNLR